MIYGRSGILTCASTRTAAKDSGKKARGGLRRQASLRTLRGSTGRHPGSPKPPCWGGKLLGPWNDPDGTDATPAYRSDAEMAGSAANDRLSASFLFGTETVHLTHLFIIRYRFAARRPPQERLLRAGTGGTQDHPLLSISGQERDGMGQLVSPTEPGRRRKSRGTLYRENVDAATIDHFIAQVQGRRQGGPQSYLHHRMVQRGRDGLSTRSIGPKSRRWRLTRPPILSARLNDSCPADAGHAAAAKATAEIEIFNPGVPACMSTVPANCGAVSLSREALVQLTGIGVRRRGLHRQCAR